MHGKCQVMSDDGAIDDHDQDTMYKDSSIQPLQFNLVFHFLIVDQ